MRVLHVPAFDGNHYQRKLFESLESIGVDVTCGQFAVPLAPFVHRILMSDIDILHVHWTHPFFLFGSKTSLYKTPFSRTFCRIAAVVFLIQVWLATQLCDRVVWTVHNKCNHERRYESLDKWVSERLVSIVDAVQVWDERTERELATYLDGALPETYRIPHGNYCGVYETVPKDEARTKLDIPRDERVFLYFGMIRPYKDVPGLINAFDTVEEGTLVVAGNPKDESMANRIRELAAERDSVRLELDYIPDEEVPLFFGASDFVVLPYKHVFNSGSVLLAMSLGRPVIAPEIGAIPSLLPEENVVYDDLKAGLRTAANFSTQQARQVGQRNLRKARTDHDWQDVAEKTERMYSGLSTT